MRGKKVSRQFIWSIIIAVIMVSSVFGVIFGSFSSTGNSFKYNGFSFTQTNQGYRTKVSGREVFFSYAPYDVENIELDPEITNIISSTKMLHITYDSESSLREGMSQAQFSLSNELYDIFGTYASPAMEENNPYNIPVITCINATVYVPVISLTESNETGIFLENNCILIKSNTGVEFLVLKDRLLYSLAGIVE